MTHPVCDDWTYSRADERWLHRDNIHFQKEALEMLYIAASHSGGICLRTREESQRLESMVDELAVALVGGIPHSYEELT